MSEHKGAPIDSLAATLPPGAVSTRRADRLAVATDLWPRHLIRMALGETSELPAAVVWPETTEQVGTIVRHAIEHGYELVPYGAGSSVVGGATASSGQVVLDFKRMGNIVELDAEGRTVTVQAGLIGELLDRQLARAGYTQGHYPSSIICSSVGGWIAARGAGQMSSRYGKIEDQLVGGTLVLGDGSVIRHRSSPARDAELDALIGAEGTLALWCEAVLRIHPLPRQRAWRGVLFPDLPAAAEAIQRILRDGISPSVVRIYDPLDTFLHRQSHGHHEPHDRGPSHLARIGAKLPKLTSWLGDRLASGLQCIIGLQGDGQQVALELQHVLETAAIVGGKDQGPGPGERWFARRYAVSYAQSRAYRAGVAVDTMEVACTWDRLVPTYERVRTAALKSGAQVLAHFSHVYIDGGSIYFTFALPVERGVDAYDMLWRECLKAAIAAGANVSHHHGIGRLKARALASALGGARREWIELQQRLDPNRVLNPGVLSGEADRAAEMSSAPPERHASAELATATPDETVAAIDARLRRVAATLGPAAELFFGLSVLDAAKRRWLWHFNPQLRIIEPLLMGVDTAKGHHEEYAFTPAPRAAMGPELTGRLLSSSPKRLWLRSSRLLDEVHIYEGSPGACLALARKITGDELCGHAPVSLELTPNQARLEARLWPNERGALAGERIEQMAVDEGLSPASSSCAGRGPLEEGAMFVAGTWRALSFFAGGVCEAGATLSLPWADPVGAAGFVVGFVDAQMRETVERQAHDCGCLPEVERREAASPDVTRVGSVAEVSPADPAVEAELVLKRHVNELDNCTYCPKLCRFSCPVAVSDGNDALIPRQLMLTANQHRIGQRAMSADVASRLWSCIDCRSCRSFCDHANDVATTLMKARAELVEGGAAPGFVEAYLRDFAAAGRPPDRTPEDRVASIIEGNGSRSSTWLFLGCQNNVRRPDPAAAALVLARRHFGAVHVLDGEVGCCGLPLWRWGDRVAFCDHAKAFAKQLRGARRLVVDDPGCAWCLRELYPKVGALVPEVITTQQLLAYESWRLKTKERLVTHDDPFSVRWLGEPPLASMAQIRGALWPAGGIFGSEAGASGGMLLPIYDQVLADKVARARVHDLLGAGAERILTASPTELRRLNSAGAPVVDLLELWLQR